jgi:hypothetical protein
LKSSFVASVEANYRFAEIFDDLGRWSVDTEQATHFFAGFVGDKRAALTQRSAGIVNRLGELFVRSPGVRGESLRDVLSAVTNYYTHESAGSIDEKRDDTTERNRVMQKQWLSSEFGTAAMVKRDAFERLQSFDAYVETVEAGADLWTGWQKAMASN